MKTSTSRREFIRLTTLTTAAFTLGFRAEAMNDELITGVGASKEGIALNQWISIDTNGIVTLFNHRSEMGQGAFQVVPQMLAEELEVNLDKVNILFAPGDPSKYGSQVTGGSSTVRGAYKRLLRMGASARMMLIEAAAKKWNVPQSECYALNGEVIHKASGKKFGYGELIEAASALQAPRDVVLKKRENYSIIGKPLKRQDIPSKVNGKAVYGLDKKIPGMLYAVVERNPRFLGKVKSFDDTSAKAITGVKHVVKVQMDVFDKQREGVAVLADSIWSAMQGRKALKVEWDDEGFEHVSTDQLYARMKEDLKKQANSERTHGNFDAVFSKADKKVEAIYETPYESHSCMEPLTCTAHVQDDKVEIWGPIQGPDWVQGYIAGKLNLKTENVIVNMTFLGGGFGRKAFLDYPHEAVMLSKAVKAPVQVVWTREDDMTQGPFRPGGIYECKGALNNEGRMVGYQTRMASQNMDLQSPNADRSAYNSSNTEGFLKTYLETIPHYGFSDIPTESIIPVMWWRSVYSSTNGFAFESFMDEMAIAAGKDPLDFRRNYMSDRYLALTDKLEEVSGWKNRGKNTGYGVAITECFDSIVGEVVKVSKQADGKIRIDKVFAVMDCGWYVNPDIIRQQIEGSIIMALGAAVKHETHFADGKAVERNFDSYKMPRINEIPEIEIYIMENDEKAGGVGEPALPPLAPALCNAIFDLTGKRIRKLPFELDKV